MPRAAHPAELSIFQQHLIGTWTNQNLPGTGKGDASSPYSYNVMPLPQESRQPSGQDTGYILKNFTLYETVTFHGTDAAVTVPGAATNRGGAYAQTAYALFYDQQVRTPEGPAAGKIVHLENGAWLHLQTEPQIIGPYGYPSGDPLHEKGDPVPQPPGMTIAKQISVPHGNSVLALGSFSMRDGSPDIPDAPSVFPVPDGLNTAPYSQALDSPANYQNPQPAFALGITSTLQQAVSDLESAAKPVLSYIHCHVDTVNGGAVMNIPFEIRKAALTRYVADYWLLSLDGVNYDTLAYVQTMELAIMVNGARYTFPHATANVISKSA
jgi:hypothetical protein